MTATASEPTSLTLRLFGPFEARVGDQPLPRLRSNKGRWLLALLALRAAYPATVRRAWLASTLWPDSSDAQALHNLRLSLTDLRRALGVGAERLRSPDPRTLTLDVRGADVDVTAFDAAIADRNLEALASAVALYRGSLLEECREEWVVQERENREQAFLEALERLGVHALSLGDPAGAERHLRRAVGTDPLRETAQRSLMEALAAGGNYAAVTQVYRDLRLLLHQELNAEPAPETRAEYERIRLQARERAGGRPVPLVSPAAAGSARELLHEGTATFLMTDVEGSTRLWDTDREMMRTALERHDSLLIDVIERNKGEVVKGRGEGDSFFAVFRRATDAVAAARDLQWALLAAPWPAGTPIRVRVALHTGEAELRTGDYYGPAVNRCARLRAAAHGGQVLLSASTADVARDALPEGVDLRDLGEHRLKDLTRPERIFQLLHPDLSADFEPLRSLEAFAHNLPFQLTSFIGREREIAEVKHLLRTSRMLTLTGAGGCGKTRLALQVAADLIEEYPGGVWLVELAALSDPALVPQTVATALGVREEPQRPLLATLTDALRAKKLLLILDNCEHLIEACAGLAGALLRACGELCILATSRQPLGIVGETLCRVPSLSLPDPERLPQETNELPGEVTNSEAVQLFVDRALLRQPAFALTAANAATVATICHRLDGIPLAIELASVRVNALSLEQIRGQLDDRFRHLTGGSRDALPRHQTLRAAVDWSYDLLTEGERTLLRRLSVFAGGFTLAASEQICSGGSLDAEDVVILLGSLVDKSLVLRDDEDDEPRYRLLETIRQYGWEKLCGTEEAEELRARHRDWFLALAERAEPELQGPAQANWLVRLERDYENLRAALGWCVERGQEEADAETGLRLGGALWRFWYVRGYLGEGRARLLALLALPAAAAPTVARAGALNGAGGLAHGQGEYAAARVFHEGSLAIRRELGDQHGIATSLNNLGLITYRQGDHAAARALHEQSLAIVRQLDDKRGISISLNNLGTVAQDQGDYAAARALHEQSLAIKRVLGDQHGIAASLNNLGLVACDQGDYAAGRVFLEESLAIARELGDQLNIAMSLGNLGLVAECQGDYPAAWALHEESLAIRRELGDQSGFARSVHNLGMVARDHREYGRARALHEESLAIARELGDQLCIGDNLESIAALALTEGRLERAARLFGAAAALREAVGSPLAPREQEEHERDVAVARDALGETAFAATWKAGWQMSLEEAVAYALSGE